MGQIIQTFTFDRNTLKRNTLLSAESVHRHINIVKNKEAVDKTASNIIGALAHYMGVFAKTQSGFEITQVADAFDKLYVKNSEDAFQWVLTRSLWRFAIPNGTACSVNEVAKAQKIQFSLFPTLLGLLLHLQTLPGRQRFLYHEEFCRLYDNDTNWSLTSAEIFLNLSELRKQSGVPEKPRRLLDDLEPEYGIPRDNLNGYLNKALLQTGLFQEEISGGSPIGLSLSPSLDQVLQRRIRHIIDNPVMPDLDNTSWDEFLKLQANDLPQEAATTSVSLPLRLTNLSEGNLSDLAKSALADCQAVGLRVDLSVMERLIASLLAKPFVILTGLSGSGKTRLAHAIAVWLTQGAIPKKDPFSRGSQIKADRISYFVHASDSVAVVFLNEAEKEQATRVCLPRDLIAEWAAIIRRNAFTRGTPARAIRDAVGEVTSYSTQLNSFETHLKAAAFAILEADGGTLVDQGACRVVAVGADWTNREPIFGYPDALSSGIYRMPSSGILELIIQAKNDSTHPYFLILDEMNLSHVERYFADMLSAMESGAPIKLHDTGEYKDGQQNTVPEEIAMPPNLFVLGTVNVDETTYMFSPKVLDRANVIEFRVSKSEIGAYLKNPTPVDLAQLVGKGTVYAEAFVEQAKRKDVSLAALESNVKETVETELESLFDALASIGAEFGYRPAYEISRFIYYYADVAGATWTIHNALDAAILQKILPKLHWL